MSMSDREVLHSALPAIKKLCEGRKERAISHALSALREGTLTGERAIHLWMEVNVVDGFLRSVETKVKLKETAEEVNG